MPTQAQQSANALNSSSMSTGPTTDASKRRASRKWAKHHLTAKQLVVAGEDPEDYTDLDDGLDPSWTPANPQESLLVELIVQNAWRLMRVRRLETAMFEKMMPSLEPRRPAIPGTTQLRVPANHDQAMLRAFERAMAETTKLRKQRTIQGIGSVSQNRKQHATTPNSEATKTGIPFGVHSAFIRGQ